jgi:hypothetical protein
MITADQLLAHAIGDYVIQSDWMATTKTKQSFAAAVHAVSYAIPFLLLTTAWAALAFIITTHFVIDRWRLARFVNWAKNWLGPGNRPWAECSATGATPEKPPFLAVWLLIITDNVMHVVLNGIALWWLT